MTRAGATLGWIAGLVLAVTGVVLARVIAPGTSHPFALGLTGQGVALAGLLVIAVGIGRRYRDRTPR